MAVAARVPIITRATSCGGTDSLIERRASIEGPGTAMPETLLRLSVGLESPEDLVEDLNAVAPAVIWTELPVLS